MKLIRVLLAETEEPIRSQKSLRAINELLGTQQGYLKERNKQKIKRVYSGYRDLSIGIKGIQCKSFQFDIIFIISRRDVTLKSNLSLEPEVLKTLCLNINFLVIWSWILVGPVEKHFFLIIYIKTR